MRGAQQQIVRTATQGSVEMTTPATPRPAATSSREKSTQTEPPDASNLRVYVDADVPKSNVTASAEGPAAPVQDACGRTDAVQHAGDAQEVVTDDVEGTARPQFPRWSNITRMFLALQGTIDDPAAHSFTPQEAGGREAFVKLAKRCT